jgi:hypothetical protein
MFTARVNRKLAEEKKSQPIVSEACSEQLYVFMKKMKNKKFTAEDEKTVSDLIQKGASVNYCKPKHVARDGKRYKSTYIRALEHGNVNVIRMCLEAGANVNEDIKQRFGWDTFPMQMALLYGRLDVARLLLMYNADLEKEFNNPFTLFRAEFIAAGQRFDREGGMTRLFNESVHGMVNSSLKATGFI